MASLSYPRTPLSPRWPLSFFRFTLFFSLVYPISFPFHTPYFCHPHRPTRILASTDADARIDRRRRSYRPTRMIFVDVSQCQTFTFVLPNLYFRAAKPLLLWFKTSLLHFILSFSCNIFHCFPRSVVLSCCVHPLVAALKTVSLAYNNIMCASTMWCFDCKQLLKRA